MATPTQTALASATNTKTEQDADKRLSDLNALIDRMIAEAKPVTERWIAMWDDAVNYAFNNQLAAKKRKKGWPAIQLNMIWPAIKQEVAILAQRKPQIFAEAASKENIQKARWWSANLQSRFERMRMGTKTVQAVLDGALTGWYIAYIYPDKRSQWDDDAKRWIYEPKVTILNPRFFGMDPNAECLDDAMYVYCQRLVPVQWAIDQWPDMEEEILAEAGKVVELNQRSGSYPISQIRGDNEKDRTDLTELGSELSSLIRGYRQQNDADYVPPSSQDDPRAQRVLITTIHFRDSEIETVEVKRKYEPEELIDAGVIDVMRNGSATVYVVKDPEAPELANVQKRLNIGDPLMEDDWPEEVVRTVEDAPKYPYGRCVYRVNDLILNPDDEDQKWDRTRWPFEIGLRLPLPHIPQGLNVTEMVRIAQDWVNVSASHLMNWLQYHGDPVTMVEEGALPKGDAGKLRAVAGAIWRVLNINKIKRDPPPPLSAGVMEVFGLVQRHGQDSSMHDVSLGGAARTGDPTATEIAATQQATQIGLGLPMMMLDDWVGRVMKQVAELDRLNLRPGDSLHMAGGEWKDGLVAEFVDQYRDVAFDIKLEVGTSLPFDRERKRRELIELLGVFPGNNKLKEMVLDAFDVRDKESVLQDDATYQQVQAFNAQLESMAAEEAKAKEAQAAAGGAVPAVPVPEPTAQMGV